MLCLAAVPHGFYTRRCYCAINILVPSNGMDNALLYRCVRVRTKLGGDRWRKAQTYPCSQSFASKTLSLDSGFTPLKLQCTLLYFP